VIDHGGKITSARKRSKLGAVRALFVAIALAVVGVPTSANAGRTFYGWLYSHEVLPEKGVELQQWVYERNGISNAADAKLHDTAMWWGVLVGITDQLELVLPIEMLWRDIDKAGSTFNVEKIGVEARYRLTKMDLEHPDGIAPLFRIAAKRDVLDRGTMLTEGDFVLAYQSGRLHVEADFGLAARISKETAKLELRPGVGVSIETKKGLRFGAEAFLQKFVDKDLKKSDWAGVGPNMVWTTGRFWVTASFLIGVYQIETAPRVIWGVLF
jgi:hypothetical protein